MKCLVALVAVLALLCGVAHAAVETLSATQTDPRAYGYFVGDGVTRQIDIDVPSPLQLDTESLPVAGRQGQALELREVSSQRSAAPGGGHITMTLRYQVFLAPREIRVLEMPPVKLRFTGGPRAQELRIDAWPVTVAPLAPPDASPRLGLGELRPDVPPPEIDSRFVRGRLLAWAIVAAVLLAYLGHVYLALPWLRRRARPFALAYRELRGLSSGGTPEQARAAMQCLHQALNRSAGQVLFEHGVAAFIAAQPQFKPLQADLLTFFARSRSAFFGSADAADGDLRWLIDLCRRGRDLERGAA